MCPSAYWNQQAGTVVCHQLKFAAATRTSSTIKKPSGSNEEVWVDYLSCAGDEETIADCFYEETIETTSSCSRDYAAVDCAGKI